jgi:hypothetical protein
VTLDRICRLAMSDGVLPARHHGMDCASVIGIPSESLNFSFDCVAALHELAQNVNLKLPMQHRLSRLKLLE